CAIPEHAWQVLLREVDYCAGDDRKIEHHAQPVGIVEAQTGNFRYPQNHPRMLELRLLVLTRRLTRLLRQLRVRSTGRVFRAGGIRGGTGLHSGGVGNSKKHARQKERSQNRNVGAGASPANWLGTRGRVARGHTTSYEA